MPQQTPTTTILLHGAWHGGWSWDLVAHDLRAHGVVALAPDLPADDPDAGLVQYALAAQAAAPGGPGDVVVVGHSLGGLVAPLVAERLVAAGRRVRALVLVCPLVPQPGVSARDQARAEPGIYTDAYRSAGLVRHADGATSLPADVARHLVYDDCPDDVATTAARRLRPQHWKLFFEPCPLTAWPDVPTRIVAATQDRMLGDAGMHAAAQRLGLDVAWLPGGHSPMLTRPRELAGLIRAA